MWVKFVVSLLNAEMCFLGYARFPAHGKQRIDLNSCNLACFIVSAINRSKTKEARLAKLIIINIIIIIN